jgi:hypothetical protein
MKTNFIKVKFEVSNFNKSNKESLSKYELFEKDERRSDISQKQYLGI